MKFPVAVALMLACAAPALADTTPDATPRTLTVSGQGEVKAVPDRAQLSTGVVSRARTAAQALADNARAMTAVIDTLKRAGIAEKNIQTSNFSLSPQYSEPKPGTPARIAGYEATNTVSVTVDGIDKVGPAIDALVAAGSNQIDGPSFTFSDDETLLGRAREAAVKDAVRRAETIARAAGVTLGPILAISESGSAVPFADKRMFRALAGNAAAPQTPIAAGEDSVSASVSITWEIH
jgi:uncharacterized protein YggE